MTNQRPLYTHIPHPHIRARQLAGPPRGHRQPQSPGAWVAIKITNGLSTMTCALLFTILALVALPQALGSHSLLVMVAWLSQTFIQLTALAILAVGQRLLGEAGDKRAETTFRDVEAILHEAQALQDHTHAQDQHLLEQDRQLQEYSDTIRGKLDQVTTLLQELHAVGASGETGNAHTLQPPKDPAILPVAVSTLPLAIDIDEVK